MKPIVFLAGLTPAAYWIWALLTGHTSANPLMDITFATGDWTLRLLCLTIAITPVRRLTGWNTLVRFRRMIGLFAFFYGTLHFGIYIVLDRFFGIDSDAGVLALTTLKNLAVFVGQDIGMRPFITVGFTAWLLMVPLAATSTAGMIRRLGGKRWQALHRLVYVSAVLGVVHYWWLVKIDIRRPLTYGAVVAVLLGLRVYWIRRKP